MSIELSCSGCQRALRVPDTAAGKRAKCPHCGTVVTVPASSLPLPPVNQVAASIPVAPQIPSGIPVVALNTQPGNPFLQPTAPPPATVNPYATPIGNLGVNVTSQSTSGLRPVVRTEASFSSIWDPAFELWKRHLGALVLSVLAMIGITMGAYLVIVILMVLLHTAGMDPQKTPGPFNIFVVFCALFFWTFVIWLQAGLHKYYLRIARGGNPELTDFFRGARHILPIIGMALLLFLATMGVYLVFVSPAIFLGLFVGGKPPEISPGIVISGAVLWVIAFYSVLAWVSLGCSLGFHLIVDRNLGPIQAMQQSWRCMSGNRWVYFFILVIGMICYMLGVLLLGIGALFSMPLLLMLITVAYLRITGQQVATDRS